MPLEKGGRADMMGNRIALYDEIVNVYKDTEQKIAEMYLTQWDVIFKEADWICKRFDQEINGTLIVCVACYFKAI